MIFDDLPYNIIGYEWYMIGKPIKPQQYQLYISGIPNMCNWYCKSGISCRCLASQTSATVLIYLPANNS